MANRYVIVMANGTYPQFDGEGGINYVRDPELATVFYDKHSARDRRPGVHRDMGGNGQHGTVNTLDYERAVYANWQKQFGRRHYA